MCYEQPTNNKSLWWKTLFSLFDTHGKKQVKVLKTFQLRMLLNLNVHSKVLLFIFLRLVLGLKTFFSQVFRVDQLDNSLRGQFIAVAVETGFLTALVWLLYIMHK